MNCELCGTPVKVVGDTTKHYEPVETDWAFTQMKIRLDSAVRTLQEIASEADLHDGDDWHELCARKARALDCLAQITESNENG